MHIIGVHLNINVNVRIGGNYQTPTTKLIYKRSDVFEHQGEF